MNNLTEKGKTFCLFVGFKYVIKAPCVLLETYCWFRDYITFDSSIKGFFFTSTCLLLSSYLSLCQEFFITQKSEQIFVSSEAEVGARTRFQRSCGELSARPVRPQQMQAEIMRRDCFITFRGPWPRSVCGYLCHSPWQLTCLTPYSIFMVGSAHFSRP